MWRDLHAHARHDHAPQAEGGAAAAPPAKSFRAALTQIVLADLSMSLDNVLAVAGAAREHPAILVFGLLLSIGLMGLAAAWIARMLNRWRWIGYLGLLVVVYVALHMIWAGHRTVVVDLGLTSQYNRIAPSSLDITAEEMRQEHAAKGR